MARARRTAALAHTKATKAPVKGITPVLLGAWGALCLLSATPSLAASPPDFSALQPAPPTGETAPLSTAAQAAMVEVPAGAYPIGREPGPASEKPAHTVTLQAFALDRTEVTNGAFAEYLNALGLPMTGDFSAGDIRRSDALGKAFELLAEGPRGSGRYPIIALDDDEARIGFRQGRFVPTTGQEDHPVAETTWAGAAAYCAWRGARLPSEVEWEAGARGEDGRLYPWGDDRPADRLAFVSNQTAVTAPVGSRPDGTSPFGILDMAGSMAEWTSSLARGYPYSASDGREDPKRLGERVTRGGDYVFDTSPATLTATHRTGFSNAPERGHRHIGFRCARSLS